MFGPIIQGKKVILRPPRPEDLPSYVAWFADPDVNRYSGIEPRPIEEMQGWMQYVEKTKKMIQWSLETASDPPILIGFVQIHSLDEANLHGETATVIGEKSYWRKGIATEIARLRTDYAFLVLKLNKLKAFISVGNEGASKACLKAGYRQVGRLQQEMFIDGQWYDDLILELLREEWEKRNAESS